MDQPRYLVNGKVFGEHDSDLQAALARLHDMPLRPKCLCVRGGVEMCIAKYSDYVLRRMPEQGSLHHPTCPHYEIPARDSGFGQVLGEAIIERSPDVVELRLDFPLTRRVGRGSSSGEPKAPAEVRIARKKLSLRGLLHFLWERAGFNRWYPRMQGKRTYWVLRTYLLQVAQGVETKGLRLSERLFIPETFTPEKANEIAERREKALSILLSPNEAVQSEVLVARLRRHRRIGGDRRMVTHWVQVFA